MVCSMGFVVYKRMGSYVKTNCSIVVDVIIVCVMYMTLMATSYVTESWV